MDLQVTDSRRVLWSDVLHYHWLASRTRDLWDYSTYTRSSLIIGWSVIELCTSQWSGCSNVGYAYRKNLDDHIGKAGHEHINWSAGWAKTACDLLGLRKDIVHRASYKTPQQLLISRGKHEVIVAQLHEVLDGLLSHFKIAEEAWWHHKQQEDYKTATVFASGSYVMKGFDPATGHTIGYSIAGGDKTYGEVPPELSQKAYEEMKGILSGPIESTFIKQGAVDIVREYYLSRGKQGRTTV